MFFNLPKHSQEKFPRVYEAIQEINDSTKESGFLLKVSEYEYLKNLSNGWVNRPSFLGNLYQQETIDELQRIENNLERYEKKNGLKKDIKLSTEKDLHKNRFDMLDLGED